MSVDAPWSDKSLKTTVNADKLMIIDPNPNEIFNRLYCVTYGELQ